VLTNLHSDWEATSPSADNLRQNVAAGRYAPSMNEKSRNTAHTMLDFYSGFVGAEDDEARGRAFATSTAQLNEIGAFKVTKDDEGDGVTIDITPMLLASGVTLTYLFARLRKERDVDQEALLFDLRQFIDEMADEDE
jgi:hypothetical protein